MYVSTHNIFLIFHQIFFALSAGFCYNICVSILMENKIDYNEYSTINNMNYNEAIKILKSLEFDNVSVIRTIK